MRAASLPVSNEAALLAERCDAAVANGEYRLAIRLAEQIFELPPSLVRSAESELHLPASARAAGLLRGLPEEGVELYRQLYDAEVAARLREADAAGDVGQLRLLFTRHHLSTHWPAVGDALATHLMERGAAGEARAVLAQLLEAADPAARPAYQLRYAVATAMTGRRDEARREVDRLASTLDTQRDARLVAAVEQVSDWLDQERSDEEAVATHDAPLLRSAAPWRTPLPGVQSAMLENDQDIAALSQRLRRLPLQSAALAEGKVLIREHGTVYALDAETLLPTPGWTAFEFNAHVIPPSVLEYGLGHWNGAEEWGRYSPEAFRLFLMPIAHAMSVGHGCVYTIEALDTLSGEPLTWADWRTVTEETLRDNCLAARDIETGRLVWRTGSDVSHPLHGARFVDAPMPIGAALLALYVRDDSLILGVLAPTTGAVLAEQTIIGAPMLYDFTGGQAFLTVDEHGVYVATGNGVIAALRTPMVLAGGAVGQGEVADVVAEWRWARAYESKTVAQTERTYGYGPNVDRRYLFERPVLVGDVLVLAPFDSDQVFGIDRVTGELLWSRPRDPDETIVGAAEHGFLAVGQTLRCIDERDGETVVWRSTPMQITGRPAIVGTRIYAPSAIGLAVIDARTGKVIEDQWAGGATTDIVGWSAPTNLVIGADGLYAVSPTAVAKHPAPQSFADTLETDPRRRFAGAMMALVNGDFADAHRRLQSLHASEPVMQAARDKRLAEAAMLLARQTADADEQLGYLREAWALAREHEDLGWVGADLGRALEASGLTDEAIAHYEEMLFGASARQFTGRRDGVLRTASWAFAASRLRALFDGPSSSAREARLIAAAEARGGEALLRARLALRDAEAVERLREAFLQAREREEATAQLRPELIADCLPSGDLTGLADADRLQALLERCEANIALGRLDAAGVDVESIESLRAQVTGDEAELIERRWGRAQRLLKRLQAVDKEPYDNALEEAWRRSGELIGEAADAAELDALAVVLCAAGEGDRLTAIRLSDGAVLADMAGVIAGAETDRERLRERQTRELFGGDHDFGGRRGGADDASAAAASRCGRTAATMVEGGLLAVGLAPGGGGQRLLWEHPVPEWTGTGRQVVVGPLGAYTFVRKGRLACLGWLEGQTLWERDLDVATEGRLRLAGERLVLIDVGRDARVFDALTGEEVSFAADVDDAALFTTTVGDVLVQWTESELRGLSVATLETLWSQPCEGAAQVLDVWGRDWSAHRHGGMETWTLHDARTGARVAAELRGVGAVTEIAVDQERIYLAAGDDEWKEAELTTIAAYGAQSGAPLWTAELPLAATVNASALLTHPKYIPLLVWAAQGGVMAEGEPTDQLAVALLDKLSGELQPLDAEGRRLLMLGEEFGRESVKSRPLLEATATRVVISAAGETAAFGRSVLGVLP